MTNTQPQIDKLQIDELVQSFFALFTNKHKQPNLQLIYQYCVKEAVISKNTDGRTEIYNLDTFIQPRIDILTNGRLVDFEEKELSETTVIQAYIAQRVTVYHKQGVLDNISFAATGTKMFQFLKIRNEWKIVAVIWVDDAM